MFMFRILISLEENQVNPGSNTPGLFLVPLLLKSTQEVEFF